MGTRYGALALVVLALAGAATALAGGSDNGSPTTGKVGICHHTGKSQAHEWVYITPDASGVLAGHANLGHQDFVGPEDIIPAFVLVDAHGVQHSYAGQNLATRYGADLEPSATGTVTGAQILANHCAAPSAPGTTGHTTTTYTTTGHTTTGHTTTVVTTVPSGTTTGAGGTTTVHGGTTTVQGGTTTTVVTLPTQTVTQSTTTVVAGTVQAPPVTVTTTLPTRTVRTGGRTVRRVVVRKIVRQRLHLVSHRKPRRLTG